MFNPTLFFGEKKTDQKGGRQGHSHMAPWRLNTSSEFRDPVPGVMPGQLLSE